jgi:hypothetical protein
LKTNNSAMLKTVFFQKIRRTAKKFDVNTQEIRAGLILDLKVLAEMAHDQATKIKERGRPTKEHRKWAHLSGYISRSISIIGREYDSVKINEKLKELEKRINDEFGEKDTKA